MKFCIHIDIEKNFLNILIKLFSGMDKIRGLSPALNTPQPNYKGILIDIERFLFALGDKNVLCFSREIMNSLIIAKYCRCILTLYIFLFCCVQFSGETTFIMVIHEA